MERIDIDKAEDLHQSTTPGPWYEFGLPWFPDELGVLAGSNDPHAGRFVADLDPIDTMDDDAGKWARNPADARFMAEAHRLWPALLAELRAHRALEDRLRGHVDLSGHGCWVANRLAELDQALGR